MFGSAGGSGGGCSAASSSAHPGCRTVGGSASRVGCGTRASGLMVTPGAVSVIGRDIGLGSQLLDERMMLRSGVGRLSRFGCLWGCHVFPSGPASGRSGWVSSQTPSRCFRGRTATTPQEAGPCRAFLAFGHDDEATHMIPGHKGRLGVTQRHHRRVNGCEQSGHCPFASCCPFASGCPLIRCALHRHGHLCLSPQRGFAWRSDAERK